MFNKIKMGFDGYYMSDNKGRGMMIKSIPAIFVGAFLTGGAQAALIDRGGGLIYDDDLNITWLSDANYAKTQYINSGGALGDAEGYMNWADANIWVTNLNYFDVVRNVTYTDWRLPISNDLCTGNYCWDSSNEMGFLFHRELGGITGYPISGTHNSSNYELFSNIQDWFYWSDTPTHNTAFVFNFNNGSQGPNDRNLNRYVWAVRDGDVAAAAIPEPETYALVLAGLGLIGFMSSRRKIV